MKIFNKRPTKEKRKALRKDMTPQEWKVWWYLKNKGRGYRFRRQHGIGPYIVDFYCKERSLVVEIDGSQHQKNATYDAKRDTYLKSLNLTVLRFWNNEVNTNVEGVIERIDVYLRATPPTQRG